MSFVDIGLQFRGGVAAPTQSQSDDEVIAVAAQPDASGTVSELHPVIDWSLGPKLSELVSLDFSAASAGQFAYYDGAAWVLTTAPSSGQIFFFNGTGIVPVVNFTVGSGFLRTYEITAQTFVAIGASAAAAAAQSGALRLENLGAIKGRNFADGADVDIIEVDGADDVSVRGGVLKVDPTYVKFGTHTAVGAETVTGYITIRDALGNLRKLAVLS